MKKRTLFCTAAALGVAAALALSAPLAASAHVKVTPDQASSGAYTVLTFRVPTESATVSTVKLEVDFPEDTPFSSVSYAPVPGWKTKVTTSTLPKPVKTEKATITKAVTKVTWSADDGAEIKPGQFQQFAVSAGPVPDTGSIMLPTHQTYSDGSVVNWVEKTTSGAEPEHPAPVLYVNDTPAGSGSADLATVTPSDSATSASDTAKATTEASGDDANSIVATTLGIGGLVLGAIALVIAVFALTRMPRRTAAASSSTDDTTHETKAK